MGYSNTMKRIYSPIYIASCLVISVLSVGNVIAADEQKASNKKQIIRFYKLNDKQQLNRLVIRKSRLKKAGCHNFLGTKKIYRLTQIGFKSCQLFSEKNCLNGSEIEGIWNNTDKAKEFKQGGEWLFNLQFSNGEKAKSWSCLSKALP